MSVALVRNPAPVRELGEQAAAILRAAAGGAPNNEGGPMTASRIRRERRGTGAAHLGRAHELVAIRSNEDGAERVVECRCGRVITGDYATARAVFVRHRDTMLADAAARAAGARRRWDRDEELAAELADTIEAERRSWT